MSSIDLSALKLTRGVKAALPFFQGAVNEGLLTNEQILQEAQAQGFSFRRQTALDVLGILQGNVDAARAIRTTPDDVPLNPEQYGKSIGTLLSNYSYQVTINARKPDGTIGKTFVTVRSDVPLSKNQILDTAQSYGVQNYTGRGEEFESLEIGGALRSGDLEEE